ncbi:MAG: hypothetical protein IKR64_00655 [Treponema sp.]|nr:hypothetical protein [Treponema sp.]
MVKETLPLLLRFKFEPEQAVKKDVNNRRKAVVKYKFKAFFCMKNPPAEF